MSNFKEELIQAAQVGEARVTQEELGRIRALIKEQAALGFRQAQIAVFELFEKNNRLGKAAVAGNQIFCSGPIKQICRALVADGVKIEFSSDIRFVNHPEGGGFVTIVTASW